ncbi:hypothetical protein WR25_18449 [Diploscapter pachys]|uniref:Uncharacterized protein n=1 Tax=Diploscapter pachys TaxID=2018661 RepID=A0A2A2L889_9BILA|nr:hypothetical protein WR25_18449 [Diploscapter pachys]
MPSSDLTLVSSSSRRPLLLSHNGTSPSSSPPIPRPSPFASFLQSLLSTLLALLLTWRIFIFPSRKKEIENGERDVEMDQNPSDSDHQEQHPEDQSHLPQTQPAAPSSVLSLLNTDSLPETSSSSDNEERLPPLPALLQTSLPAYLDTINEEESDELRSVSSASFASPLTVVGPSPSPFGPSHSTASTHPISPLVRTSTENISDSEYKSPLAASPYHQKEDINVSVEDGQLLSEEEKSAEEGKSERGRESDDPRGLLLELAKLGKGQGSLTSSKPAMSDEKQHHDGVEKSEGEDTSEEKKTVKFEEAIKKEATEGPLHVVEKAAELQEEPLTARPAVSSSQIIHPNVPPPPLPNTSPPTTVASPIPMADDAPLEADRDRDQEEELVYNEERRRTVTMDDTNSLRSSSIQLNTANTTRDGLNESVASNPLDESAAVYRSSMKATDQMGPGSGTGTPLHGQDDRRSPPLDLPPPPPISSSHLSTSSASAPHQAPPSFPPPPVPSSTLFQTASSLRKPEIFDRSDQGMSSPPLASIPPSLPAAQSSYSRVSPLFSFLSPSPFMSFHLFCLVVGCEALQA